MDLSGLPGEKLVSCGLTDLAAGRSTVAALVVSVGAPRLRGLGVEVSGPVADAEHALWKLLAQEDPDSAHGRYNALIRELVSFERALDCVG